MRLMFSCEVIFTLVCSHCGASHVQRYRPLARFQELMHPVLPEQWRELDGLLICPAHTIEVTTR
jgi:hypothetical protein